MRVQPQRERGADGAPHRPGSSKAEAKVAEIARKLSDLVRIRETLLRLIGACGGTGPMDGCHILDAFDRGTGWAVE